MSMEAILQHSSVNQNENYNSHKQTYGPKGVDASDGSNISLLQKQMSFNTSVGASGAMKTDEGSEMDKENTDSDGAKYGKGLDFTWIFCAPCIWLRTSSTVHRVAITTATLLVTGLLVASPILFLISTAPSQLPRDCFMNEDHCSSHTHQYTECNASACRAAALSIQAKIDWNLDPCAQFKNFSCSDTTENLGVNSLRAVRSAQETVDSLMQNLLQHNTTSGLFRKVGRLFSSCLRQTTNSSTIFLFLQQLGGYLPIGALGPSTIAPLLSKIFEHGPTPIFDIYYDLSYGRRPQILLIISGPVSSPILENTVRWKGPRSPIFKAKHEMPQLLNELLDSFLPNTLSLDQKDSEIQSVKIFIKELNKIKAEHSNKGFWDSSVYYNISDIQNAFPFVNWQHFVPLNWNGPIIVRNSEYLKAIQKLFSKYPTRVAHNSLLLLFALGILPQGQADAVTCTKATMWAVPDITSALYVSQHSSDDLEDAIKRTESIFKSLKAHLKRAPSLKGTALVKLSALKIRCRSWDGFHNVTSISDSVNSIDITSDNWFQNILRIFKKRKMSAFTAQVAHVDHHDTWAYPIVAKSFYDTLSHSIVVPLSVILVPYFDNNLPPYLHYGSVGVAIAKEILRSITKNFEDKALHCVPRSVNVFSNDSRMDILIHSGGMQIAYHSLLSLTGPMKGMARLPGLNLSPSQIFFLVAAQELCAESKYNGIDMESFDFDHILTWLIAQGGSATEAFKCPLGSMISTQKTCNIF